MSTLEKDVNLFKKANESSSKNQFQGDMLVFRGVKQIEF